MKKQVAISLVLIIVSVLPCGVCSEGNSRVSVDFEEFIPSELQQGVPFELIFKLKNTGDEPITPYAEVTIYGKVYNGDGDSVLRVLDKKFRIYNFWPGDQSARQRLYIGSLEKGSYTLRLNINTYNRVKGMNVSQETLEMPLDVI